MINGLYDKSGYLNQEFVYKTAAGNGCSFVVEVGGRQVGKTYGALKLALESGEKFAYMRRTQAEIDFLSAGVGNPLTEHDRNIVVKKSGRYIATITRDGEEIGIMCALSSIAKIRGFSWVDIKTVIYDEFIPERHVQRIRDEGDAFVNAMITISGNRELEGKPPVMCWLLANPNIHSNPITEALHIVDKIDRMETLGQELSVLMNQGIVIVRPSSEALMERRRNIAIFRAAGTSSKVAGMALDNEFAYDDKTGIGTRNIKEFTAAATVAGLVTIWKHKSRSEYYITEAAGEVGSVYYQNEPDFERFRNLWSPVIRTYDRERRVVYVSLKVKEIVNKLIGKTN